MIHQSESNRTSIPRYKSSPRSVPLNQPSPTAPVEHKEGLDIANPNPVDQEPTQIETLENDNPELTECCIEEVYQADQNLIDEYEEEDLEECDPDPTSTLPEKTLEVDHVIEPSPDTQDQPETSKDLVPLIQNPQEDPTPLAITKDLIQYTSSGPTQDIIQYDPFLEVVYSSHCKLNILSPINSCSYLKSPQMNPMPFHDSSSCFLPYPETSCAVRNNQPLFVEIIRLLSIFVPVRFATYFWSTLWHLLGVYATFSSACHPPVERQS